METNKIKNNIELLAPVGSYEALKAAVQNGANAVYLGGKDFSARASANNFDRDELIEAVKYSHIRGVQVFVTVNTLIKQREIEYFVEYIKFLYDADVDALIIQDIGIAKLVKELLPDFEIHASTQMVAHSLDDVKYLSSVGFDRVVLARELNISEIRNICDNTDVDIEVFVHGALCVCYSGQCLMSSMLGNRSGNRGRCAQPCRQRYQLIDLETGKVVNEDGDYLLSTRDLNSIENIDKVIDAGVYSLKIEGRMKKPEYVATVVSSYRHAVDEYLEKGDFCVSESTMENLYTIFNRRFTKGHILGDIGNDLMNREKPNNQGLYIGKVIDCNRKTKRLKLKLEGTLKKGDGINLGGGTIGRIIKGKEISDIGYVGETIELDFIGEAKRNQRVFKTSDGELLERVKETFKDNKEFVKIPVEAEIKIKLDHNPVLTIKDENGNIATVEGINPAEKAIKVALSEEKVKSQLAKLGNTPYIMHNVNINIDDNVSMPISVLNQMRREGIDLLSVKRSNIRERKYKDKHVNYIPRTIQQVIVSNNKLRVKVKNLEQLEAVLGYNLDVIYYEDIYSLGEAIKISEKTGEKIVYSAPRVIRNGEFSLISKFKDITDKIGVQVGTWGSLDVFENNDKYIDYYLNTFNSESLNYFNSQKVKSVCISVEMSLDEIEETLKYTEVEAEAVVYGYIPMMITEYCPMGVVARDCKRDKRCVICSQSKYALESADGERFKLFQDMYCRSTIYNSKPLCVLDDLDRLRRVGISVFRLDFTFEGVHEIKEIVESYLDVIDNNNKLDGKSTQVFKYLEKNGIMEGHYYEGIE
ncbi:U32 family peptidase [Clostridioides mangenotii]|nr:U32 family peptidase [Clostridioides mangenotii]